MTHSQLKQFFYFHGLSSLLMGRYPSAKGLHTSARSRIYYLGEDSLIMELFSRRRWRLDRPKQKAVVFVLKPKNYATRAWHNSIVVWLLGRSSCSSPSTLILLTLLESLERSEYQNQIFEIKHSNWIFQFTWHF